MSNFNQFQQDAIRTEARIPKVKFNRDALLRALGVAIAAGNILDAVKKSVFYGKPIDDAAIAREASTIKALDLSVVSDVVGRETIAIDPRIFHGIVGKFTEATELLEAMEDAIATGEPLDFVNIKEELGDDQWYNAILTDATGIDMDEVQATVIAKLKARYPDKFTSEAAIVRDLSAERKVLEQSHAEAVVS